MFKRLRWIIIIPGVLAGVAQARATAPVTVADLVEKDLFEFHAPPQDLSQKDYQSADFKVTYLTDPSPTQEEKTALLESGKILSNRDWFLRRMKKNEEPATQWLKEHGFIEKDKNEPSPEQKKKALSAQTKRLKKAVSDYNLLVANLIEKRGTPKSGSVIAEEKQDSHCDNPTKEPPAIKPADLAGKLPTTLAPEVIAKLTNDYFGIAHRQIADDTTAESNKQIEAVKHDSSYVTPTTFKILAITHPMPVVASASKSNPVRISVPGLEETQSFDSIADVPKSAKLYAVSRVGSDAELFSSDDGQSWKLVSKMSGVAQGGQKIHLAVSAGSQDIVIGTAQGAFVSSDQGATFTRIGDSGSRAVDVQISEKGNQLLVGFSRGLPGGTQNNVEVFAKTANGWSALPQQPKGLDDYSAQQAGIEKTEGHSRFSTNGVNLQSVQFDPSNDGVFYAGAGNQLYRWNPSQQAWSELGRGVHDDTTVYNIDFDKESGKLLMATCAGVYEGQSEGDSPQFSKMGDRSFLWDQGPDGDGPFGVAVPASNKSLRAYVVSVDPYDHKNIAVGASTGMYTSDDSGKSWKRLQGGDWQDKSPEKTMGDVSSVAWTQDGSVIFSGSAGIFHATP